MIARHLRTHPVPPSERTSNDIPPALETLVLRCLAKEPGERPQSAAALASSLATIDVRPWMDADAAEWWSANESAIPALPGAAAAPPTAMA